MASRRELYGSQKPDRIGETMIGTTSMLLKVGVIGRVLIELLPDCCPTLLLSTLFDVDQTSNFGRNQRHFSSHPILYRNGGK
jgi:hypothetical protein